MSDVQAVRELVKMGCLPPEALTEAIAKAQQKN
jgi:hypothetical protein